MNKLMDFTNIKFSAQQWSIIQLQPLDGLLLLSFFPFVCGTISLCPCIRFPVSVSTYQSVEGRFTPIGQSSVAYHTV